MFRQLLFSAALVTMLMVNPANAQQSPPASEEANQVNEAAAPIEIYTPTPTDLASFANSDLLTAGYFGGP